MDCRSNQCCAVSKHNARCTNSVSGTSDHCDVHKHKAANLYGKYKRLSDLAKTVNIYDTFNNKQEKIKHLIKCYDLFNKTFSARMRHRRYAFVPECYDDGHDYQFIKLKYLISQCEKMLSELEDNNTIVPNISNESEDEIEESDDSDEIFFEEATVRPKTITGNVSKYSKLRKNIEDDTDQWIEKYIQDNRIVLERRNTLISNITKTILTMFDVIGVDDIAENAFSKCIMVFNLTKQLHAMNYLPRNGKGRLNKQFIPEKCKHCDCNEYQMYGLSLMCSCIHDYNTIKKYFNLCSEDTLKDFFGSLLYNKAVIIPLICDLKPLYIVHREKTMSLKLCLSWDPIKSRLKIGQNVYRNIRKPSNYFAISRMKNKYYNQQMAKLICEKIV